MATTSATATTSTSGFQAYLAQQAKDQAANAAAAASSASTSSSNALAQSTSASAIGSNFNTFINILTTQLKHQDPSNASDPNQFTQELVQFAGVEQQLNTNNDLQTMINLQKSSNGTTAALNYIGGYVQATTTSDQLALQSGSAEIGYDLSNAGANAVVTVQNSSGQTVATLQGSANTGMNYLTWNGKDSSGNQLADGTYTFSLAVTNTDGSSQTPSGIDVIGKVTAVTTNSDGTTSLSLGNGLSVSTANVTAAYGSGSLPSATTSSTAS